MRKLLAVAGMSVAFAAPSLAQSQEVGRDQEVWTWDGRIETGRRFSLSTVNGPVTIEPSTDNMIHVRAEKEVRRGSVRDVAFQVVQSGGDVQICALWRNSSCDEDGLRSRGRDDDDDDRSRRSNVNVRFDFTNPIATNVEPGARPRWNAVPPASGTASDGAGGTGVASVSVSVQRVSSSLFFDGAAFTSATPIFVAANGTTSWNIDLSGAPFIENESYRLTVRAIDNAGTVLSGVHTRYQVIDTAEQEHVAGVVFRPAGQVPFMRIPALETHDIDVPVEVLWGRSRTAMLRERLLESETLDLKLDAFEAILLEARTSRALHPAVAFALAAFDRRPATPSIAAVTDAIGMSAKRFIERFKVEVGTTPKRYCRIRRFQRAVTLAHAGPAVDWTQVALDCGYFDQSHFIHDFRSFAGLTPTEYDAARTSFQNHVKFLQSESSDI